MYQDQAGDSHSCDEDMNTTIQDYIDCMGQGLAEVSGIDWLKFLKPVSSLQKPATWDVKNAIMAAHKVELLLIWYISWQLYPDIAEKLKEDSEVCQAIHKNFPAQANDYVQGMFDDMILFKVCPYIGCHHEDENVNWAVHEGMHEGVEAEAVN